MEDFLQAPEAGDAPIAKSDAPWVKRIQYKSGKTPEGFADAALPEQVKAGFGYYDKEQQANFAIHGFTASIVAVLSGVSGTVPNGTRYDNYWSSLVQDTRSQKLAVFLGSGDSRVTVASGIYNDFKAGLPDGVGYMKYAVVYIHETKECALMQLTASFEGAIKEAIATKTGQNPAKINLFNLFELSTKFWAVRFSGEFTKRNRDGVAWNKKGDMFFYPLLDAGVVLAEKFPVLAEISAQVDAYIRAGQEFFNKKDDRKAPATQAQHATPQGGFSAPLAAPPMGDPFPTYSDAPPVVEDDLPF